MKSSCSIRHHALHCKGPANLSSSIFQANRSDFPDIRTGCSWSGSPLYIRDPCPLTLLTCLLNFTSCNKKGFKCHPLQDFLGCPLLTQRRACTLGSCPLSFLDSRCWRTRKPPKYSGACQGQRSCISPGALLTQYQHSRVFLHTGGNPQPRPEKEGCSLSLIRSTPQA